MEKLATESGRAGEDENPVLLLQGVPQIEIPPCPGTAQILATGQEACAILESAGFPFMVGGGVALWAYGRKRCTKDMDIFLPAELPHKALNVLARHGFHTRDTDGAWLYKAIKHDVLIDLIVWTTGNIRLDAETFERARPFRVNGHTFQVMGPEDLLFRKILSFREETPKDWYDGLSMVAQPIPAFDWDYFMRRVQDCHAYRVLSFLLFAQGQLGTTSVVPPGLIQALLDTRVHPSFTPEGVPGPISIVAEDPAGIWPPCEEGSLR